LIIRQSDPERSARSDLDPGMPNTADSVALVGKSCLGDLLMGGVSGSGLSWAAMSGSEWSLGPLRGGRPGGKPLTPASNTLPAPSLLDLLSVR